MESYNETVAVRDSGEIMALLARDGIGPSEVDDYRMYPVADNESPRLSGDRLEYSLSTMLVARGAWRLSDIKAMYDSLAVVKAEDGRDELAFRNMREAVFVTYCRGFRKNKNKLSLMYVADLLKACIRRGILTYDELYALTEAQVIGRMEQSEPRIRDMWQIYRGLDGVKGSLEPVPGCYCARVDAKKRHIDPFVAGNGAARRVTALSARARKEIEGLPAFADLAYGWIVAAPARDARG